MKKVLYYENRKSGPVLFDASTPELEMMAFYNLFIVLDEQWEVYFNLNENQQKLYDKAKMGSYYDAQKLLKLRCNNEYEHWSIIAVK